MPLIGSRKVAKEIYDFIKSDKRLPPDKWRSIGSGSFRSVYLHVPTQVVYKVDDYMYDQGYTNKRELHNARVLRKMSQDGFIGKKCRIPKVSGYKFGDDIVLAMEHIKGEPGPNFVSSSKRAAEGRRTLHQVGRFEDMHEYNYLVEKGAVVVPVDMGSPRVSLNFADTRVLHGLPEKKVYQKLQGW